MLPLSLSREWILISRGDVFSLFVCHSNNYKKIKKYINMLCYIIFNFYISQREKQIKLQLVNIYSYVKFIFFFIARCKS